MVAAAGAWGLMHVPSLPACAQRSVSPVSGKETFTYIPDTNETLKRITLYEGTYGERGARHNGDYLFSELLEARSCEFGWDIKPHAHPALYQVFFIQKGALTFYGPSQQLKLKAPCLIFIPPAVLHGFKFTTSARGRILTVSSHLIDGLFRDAGATAPLPAALLAVDTFTKPYVPSYICGLIEAVDEELFNNMPEKRMMLRACLEQLMLVIYRMSLDAGAGDSKTDSIALGYFRKFQERLRKVSATDTVKEIAGQLGITPVHLNRVCKELAGKPAGKLLEEYLLEEARKLLTYTSYSVSEIAYLLNFSYPNYFARFFRKHTGLSPKAFRENEGA